MNRFAGLVALIVLAGCASPPLPPESEPVVALMSERLSLARDVAWAKWIEVLPVRDPERESALAQKLFRQGAAAGLNETQLARFIQTQIDASRIEQHAWMKRWKNGTPLPEGEPPTLDSLRSQLDQLSALLVAEYAAAPDTPTAAARTQLKKSGFTPCAAAKAASGFSVK